MKIFLQSFFIMLLFSANIFAQVWVEGYCFLENQVDHSGVTVLYEAASPGAVTTSSVTTTEGRYQASISPGIYNISFNIETYYSEELQGINCLSSPDLPTLTLEEIYQGIHLSEGFSGILIDTIYIVNESISVNSPITILAGATFYFGEESGLYFEEPLIAKGTAENTINFLANKRVDKGGEVVVTGNAVFEYCIFDHTEGGLFSSGESDTVTIENCIFTNNVRGVSILGSNNTEVNYCLFDNNGSEGIHVGNSAPSTITNCTIINSDWLGIRMDDGDGSMITISNCIIAFNSVGIAFPRNDASGVKIFFCDFYGNSGGNFTETLPPFLGEISLTNYNGDPCDVYYNIFENPLFLSKETGDYNLDESSPAIDAGDPTMTYDPDTTVRDLGTYYHNQGPHSKISVNTSSINYQEVVVDEDSIAQLIITNSGNLTLFIHDIQLSGTGFSHNWILADSIIAPSSDLIINVVFSPTEFRDYTGSLKILNSDKTRYINLTGIGVPPKGDYPTSLIVTGGGNDTTNWNYYINNTNPSTNDAYNKLSYGRYYGDTRLYYMNPESYQDLNGNTIDDGIVDGDSLTPQTFHEALINLYDSDNPDFPNILFLAGHGHVDEFDINGDAADNIEIDTLAKWLDEANLELSTPLVVIFEACFSGGYIEKLAAPNRVIISACESDQFADYLNGESFSTHFWYEIWYGNDLWTSFDIAGTWSYAHLNEQLPLLDADGNGIPNESTDQEIASQIYLGGRYMHGALLPEIVEVPEEVDVNNSQFSLSVTCNGKMDKVWFRIYPKDYSGVPSVADLPYKEMYYTGNGGYSATYHDEGFIVQDEEYIIRLEAVADIFNYAVPRIIPINVITTDIEDEKVVITYQLNQAYPNPFNPTTTISYQIPVPGKVTLTVYNLLGQRIWQRMIERQIPGQHKFKVDLSNQSSGVYFYRLEAGNFVQTKKMILLK